MARSILAATSFALALALIPASASAIGSVEESLRRYPGSCGSSGRCPDATG
jgi:hypothetical protein